MKPIGKRRGWGRCRGGAAGTNLCDWLWQYTSPESHCNYRRLIEFDSINREKSEDVGVLHDISSPHNGNGSVNASVLRWTFRTTLRSLHRWIHLVRFPLHHHPRPRWYLGGTIPFSISHSLQFNLIHHFSIPCNHPQYENCVCINNLIIDYV